MDPPVLIKQKFRSMILSGVERAFKEILGETEEQFEKYQLADICYEAYIPISFRNLAAQLNLDPKGQWLTIHPSAYITIRYTDKNGHEGCVHHTKSTFIKYRSGVPLPLRYYSLGDLVHFELPKTTSCYNEVVEICKNITSIKIEQQRTLFAVNELIDQCKYLHHLVPIWPDALKFLPSPYHNLFKLGRQPRSNKAKAIQLPNELKATFLKLKLLDKL